MKDKHLPNDALKVLFQNLSENELKVLLLYKDNLEGAFTQEDIKSKALLSTNDARVSLYKLEAILFIDNKLKGRGNNYMLNDNGKKIIKNLK